MLNGLKNKYYIFTCVVIAAVWFAGCESERKESPTKGHVTMISSESVAPLIQQEKKTFEELYPQAHVELLVASAREAIARLFNDSITVVVSSRQLNAEEREVQKRANLTIGEWKIAYDGVAVIVNSENALTRLRTTQLDSIFSGKITRWKSAGSDLSSEIEVCLPNRNSGTFEFAVARILKNNDTLAPPAMVVQSSLEMINFVAKHQSAIVSSG